LADGLLGDAHDEALIGRQGCILGKTDRPLVGDQAVAPLSARDDRAAVRPCPGDELDAIALGNAGRAGRQRHIRKLRRGQPLDHRPGALDAIDGAQQQQDGHHRLHAGSS
jgi:hypothetical protein